MISDTEARECYVYIVLPGTTEFVTAGRFVLEPDRSGLPVGRFVYGRRYLEHPDVVPIDPVELKLGKTTYRTTALKGVFGALRDAGPDYWGRRVIEKHAGKPQLGELDYLLYAPDDRAGALGFGLGQTPPAPKRHFSKTLDLEKLVALADAIVADEEVPESPETEQAENLMLIGTSMGGARPKTVVEDEDGLWIAKFNRPDDNWNHARVEHAMLALARDCGIRSAESRIITAGDRDVLLVRRFDREKARAFTSNAKRPRFLSRAWKSKSPAPGIKPQGAKASPRRTATPSRQPSSIRVSGYRSIVSRNKAAHTPSAR